jgi:predicted nucleic acid-binding protein
VISALLDTSFFITLADPSRAHHMVARHYFTEALQQGCPLYLSAIVASEFQVKQAVTDLPLRNLNVLPFNIDHAMMAGQLMKVLKRDRGDDRAVVKDDVKLIAQMVCESITHVLTEDHSTLAKYLLKLNDAGHTKGRSILLKEGFDPAWFNNGQKNLLDT